MVRITREAWRDLGFWYGPDLGAQRWLFRADRRGVGALVAAIRQHVAGSASAEMGEHLHLGPYASLRLIHGDRPLLNLRGISGSPEDFELLIEELESLAAAAEPGAHVIARHFAQAGFGAVLTIEPDGFDPAGADPMINGEPEP